MSINIRRLRAFVTVARLHSVTEASRELNMTPPAVTKSVRELELALGTPVFLRTSTGMTLTPAGEVFHIHALRALAEIERGRDEVSELIGGTGGRVAVGATPDAANVVLPTALAQFVQRRGRAQIAMYGGPHEALARDVRTGALDFFVGVGHEGAPAPSGLALEPLYDDPLRIIVRPRHPLVGRPHLTLDDLSPYRWIDASGRGALSDLIRRHFHDAPSSLDNDIVVEQLGAMRAMVQQTDLLALVTLMRVREELDLGVLVALPIALPLTHHRVCIFTQQNGRLSVSVQHLLTLVRRAARDHAPPLADTSAAVQREAEPSLKPPPL